MDVVVTAPTVCPACGSPARPQDQFCEACGSDLVADLPAPEPAQGAAPSEADDPVDGAALSARTVLTAPPGSATATPVVPEAPAAPTAPACAQCGGRFADDGYCEQCGSPAPRARDHWVENPASWVAAACDRGQRHQANEDAVAVAAAPLPEGLLPEGPSSARRFAALVVCDGVSTALASDVASLAAARTARDVLIAARDEPLDEQGWSERMVQAGLAANQAVAKTPAVGPGPEPGAHSAPSCTFVAAVVDGDDVLVGWVGDSRAYWLPDGPTPAEQLTVDDSWATLQIDLGMPREQAETMPNAHAITRWLGEDSPDPRPLLRRLTLDGPGWLLVCSDGLWNYCSAAAELRSLVADSQARVGAAPSAVALELVAWANRQGGSDNITVALARIDGVTRADGGT